MSIPACNAIDRVQFPADERNTLFLAQDFIWKYLWKLAEKGVGKRSRNVVPQ